jgi:hypothetical protein
MTARGGQVSRKRGARKRAVDESFDQEWERLDAEFDAQAAEMARSGRTMTRVLLFLFAGIAALMLVIALLTGISTARRLSTERSALAQVIDMTERKSAEESIYYYPVVAFDLPGGQRQRVQLAEGSWPPAHRVGDLVTVRYQPANPLDARIDTGGGTAALWTWTIVTGALAVAFALAAALAWWMGKT